MYTHSKQKYNPMKIALLLLTFSFALQADTYHVKYHDNGAKGVIALEMPLLEGWKISPSKAYGDYLISHNNSVYFTASLMTGLVNDDNQTLSESDFEATREFEKSEKHSLNGVDIYSNFNGTDEMVNNYAFSKFYQEGVALYGTMIPYPDVKSESLQDEVQQIIEMLSQAQLSQETLDKKREELEK